jgi:hypothetical protein
MSLRCSLAALGGWYYKHGGPTDLFSVGCYDYLAMIFGEAVCKGHTGKGKNWIVVPTERIQGGVAARAGYEKNSLASKVGVVLFRAPNFGRGTFWSGVFDRRLFCSRTTAGMGADVL